MNHDTSILLQINWLLKQGFGGAMVWSIDNDDFTGKSCAKKYPILNIIKKCLLQENGYGIFISVIPNNETIVVGEKPI